MIARRNPIVLWVRTRDKIERKITATATEDLLLKYTITSPSGTPLGAEYIHTSFYRDRPSVAHNDWQDTLIALLESYGVEIVSKEIP